jgi:hypothetical protein
VSGVLQRYLELHGFTDVTFEPTEAYRTTGYFVGADGLGVEPAQWDGLFLCMKGGAEVMFLLEAKKTQTTEAMSSMPERVARTMAFVGACHDRQVPPPGAKQCFKTLCLMWDCAYACSSMLIGLAREAKVAVPQPAHLPHRQHDAESVKEVLLPTAARPLRPPPPTLATSAAPAPSASSVPSATPAICRSDHGSGTLLL